MVWMFVWLGLTLGAAAVVFLFASVVARSDAPTTGQRADEQGLRGFWRNFRSGVRRGRPRGRVEGHHVGTVRMPKPVDTGIEEFFAATEVSSRAYVDAEELTDVLHHARERAARPFHTGGDRSRDA
jgi:selenocysteine lyase/cysteine desulfurase